MKRQYIDLHVHTNASDGLYTPKEVAENVINAGLQAVAITDHDTVLGYIEVAKHLEGTGIEAISGVELSCYYKEADVHILGYFIDHTNPEFVKKIQVLCQDRYERGEEMVSKLNYIGINLSMETVKDIAGKSAVGRPHVADALLKEEFVQTYDEAFARYLGYHAPAYVPKKVLSPEHGIDMLHLTGGIAVLAHPGTLKHDEFIPDLVEMGLDGIEAYHSQHTKPRVQKYKTLAKKHDIAYSGGSDCHGPRKGRMLLGSQNVPYSVLELLKKAKEKRL